MANSQDLESRLAAARAKLEERNRVKAAAGASDALLNEVERAEREVLDADAIDAAEAKLGKQGKAFAVIVTDLGAVIVKRAPAPTYKKFQDEGDYKFLALEKLVFPLVEHPDRTTFERMIDEQPHILVRCGNAVGELAGVRSEAQAGK